VLRVAFSECDRAGRYRLDRLIKDHGHEAKIVDWLDEITADCSKKSSQNWNDQCAARCPDLPKILLLSVLCSGHFGGRYRVSVNPL